MAFLVRQEKVDGLHEMLAGLEGPRREQTRDVHRQAGVHERGYLQPLPDGNFLYIAVFESEEASTALARVMAANAAHQEYAPWIFSQLQGVFEMDPNQGLPPLPEQVYDSGPVV